MNIITSVIVKAFSLFNCKERVCGRDRQVFIFDKHVVKVPVTNSWLEFIRGYYSNLRELDVVSKYTGRFPDHVMGIKASYCFGLFVVVEKYVEVPQENEHIVRMRKRLVILQDQDDMDNQFVWMTDNKVFNFGWNKYGQLVKLDLGTYH